MTKARTPGDDKGPVDPRPSHWADALDELHVENLHRITPTLYRSAQPRRADMARRSRALGKPSAAAAVLRHVLGEE